MAVIRFTPPKTGLYHFEYFFSRVENVNSVPINLEAALTPQIKVLAPPIGGVSGEPLVQQPDFQLVNSQGAELHLEVSLLVTVVSEYYGNIGPGTL